MRQEFRLSFPLPMLVDSELFPTTPGRRRVVRQPLVAIDRSGALVRLAAGAMLSITVPEDIKNDLIEVLWDGRIVRIHVRDLAERTEVVAAVSE